MAEEEEAGDTLARSCKKPSMEVIEAEAVGLNAIFILMSRVSQVSGSNLPPLSSLVGPRKASPVLGGEPMEDAETGSSSLMTLAKPFQKAEALLRHCVSPSLWLSPRACKSTDDSEEEEDSPGGLARLALVEHSFLALSRCLSVQENPRTETFQGHLRPAAPDTSQGAFSYHVAHSSVARQCTTLHALLQHRHHLRLSRLYTLRLKAASDFVRRLATAVRRLPLPVGGHHAGWGPLLRGLCEEMRTHACHWDELQQRIRRNPWLQPVLLQPRRQEVVQHMKRSLSSLALHAVRLLERCVEAVLCSLAQAPPVHPAPLSDFFRGLEIYNQVVRGQAVQQAFAELQTSAGAGAGLPRVPGSSHTFPVERVLRILAAERGRLAARRLHLLLLPQQGAGPGTRGPAPREGSAKSGRLDGAPPAAQAGEGPPSLSAGLQSLCQEEEEAVLLLLQGLVASSDTLWHHVLHRPKQEKPLERPKPDEGPGLASLPSWKSVRWLDASFAEATGALCAQYRPLLWSAAATSLAHLLELHLSVAQSHEGLGPALGRQLSSALAQACMPHDGAEELRSLVLRLLIRDTLRHWDRGFCCALGSSLADKCLPRPARAARAACSRTAEMLQSLCLPLTFSLQHLDDQPSGGAAGSIGAAGLRLELLSLVAATGHASCYWAMSRAYQYLASWSLSQFLLVTQGDLQLLKAEANRMSAVVTMALSEGRKVQSPLVAHQEQELSLQIHSTATSIRRFADDVLKLFSSDCRRMSAEIFGQTMPLGKRWRLALQTELPTSPSEYALAAAQSVLGQVLQGIQLLPQEAQGLALSQVTTAFLEAWMDHILAQKIKFSLQGALQLRQDFDLVRRLLLSEGSGLSPEIQQLVCSLPVFQRTDSAIACLLQQPSKASLPSHTWDAFHKCCSYDGIHTPDGGPGSLNSLESLEGLPGQAKDTLESQAGDFLSHVQGGGCSPATYLSPTQQEWLALRLHGGRRWKVPALPCLSRTTEP